MLHGILPNISGYICVVDVFEEFFSPVTAAQGLLHVIVSKRKEMLQKTMGFVMQVSYQVILVL